MKNILKHIPNFLTSLNLLCGALAVFVAYEGLLTEAAYFIFAGALFDFSDGFAARALKAYSPMGKELDSLADMVSFGLAPMVILHMMLKEVILHDMSVSILDSATPTFLLLLSPFLITVFSGLRLAKFNVDTRQSESFIGLTTTATGLFISSLGYVFTNQTNWLHSFINHKETLLAFVPIFCFLLVSEIPMFSLKFKDYKFKNNIDKYILLLTSLIFIIWLGIGGIAITIALYVLFSLSKAILKKS